MVVGRLPNMCSIEINSSSGSYFVEFNSASLEIDSNNVVIVKDRNVATPDFLHNIKAVIEVVGNEELKTLDSAGKILSQLASLNSNKNTTLIAIGGGSVQDVCTLVSSLFMRGIDWIYIPTTLMAIADSCIGGKSSINVGNVKNLVGNFYPPQKVIIDLGYVSSLSKQSIAAGLMEAVKINFAKSPVETENWISDSLKWLVSFEEDLLKENIARTLQSKKWFIEIDEFDKNERKLLNFGHSFGHALEAATEMKLQHGLAVGLGMLCALKFSEARSQSLETYIKSILRWAEFSSNSIIFDSNIFKSALKLDKKNSKDTQRLVVLGENNSLVLKDFILSSEFLDLQNITMLEILGEFK